MLEARHTSVEYSIENNEPIIHIFARTKENEDFQVEVEGFEPYFYVPKKEIQKLKEIRDDERIRRIEKCSVKSLKGKEVIKVVTQTPKHVGSLREKFDRTFEADIVFEDRFLVDTEISEGFKCPERKRINVDEIERKEVDIDSKNFYFDIEVDDSNGFPEFGEEKILSISFLTNESDTVVVYVLGDKNDSYEKEVKVIPNEDYDSCNEEAKELIEQRAPKGDDQKLKTKVVEFPSEFLLLKKFTEVVDNIDPHNIIGYNNSGFDVPYVIKRLESLSLHKGKLSKMGTVYSVDKGYYWHTAIRGRTIFDLYNANKRLSYSELRDESLEGVSRHNLGIGKKERDVLVSELWKNDRDELIEYNAKDSILCLLLDQVDDMVKFFDRIARKANVQLKRAYGENDTGKIVDRYMLTEAKDEYILPNRRKSEGGGYAGAAVLEPYYGIEENVIALDLASLYPSIMSTCNMSPETLVKEERDDVYNTPIGHSFRKDKDGFVNSIIDNLLDERYSYKDKRNEYPNGSGEWDKFNILQRVVKEIANAIYGVMGNPKARLPAEALKTASAVTSVGRALIEFSKEVAEENGYKVIYGDTDSIYIKGKGDTKKELIEEGRKLSEVLNQEYDRFAKESLNTEEHQFKIEMEKVCTSYLQYGVKKRYAAWVVWDEGQDVNKPMVKGFESIKESNSALITIEAQDKAFKTLLKEKDPDKMVKILKNVCDKFDSIPLEYIWLPEKFTKDISKYNSSNQRYKGGKYSRENLGVDIQSGDRMFKLYIKRTPKGYPNTDIIYVEEEDDIPDEFQIDYDKMIEKTLKNPLEDILKLSGKEWSDVKIDGRQTKLI